MAWSSPSTWVAGAVLTAAQLNAQVRDNLLALYSGTGWVDATYASGYQTQGTRQAKSTVKGKTVSLDGLITKTSGSFPTSAATVIATLPVGHRPPDTKRFACGQSALQLANIAVASNGEVSIITSSSAPTYVSLDGITFELD